MQIEAVRAEEEHKQVAPAPLSGPLLVIQLVQLVVLVLLSQLMQSPKTHCVEARYLHTAATTRHVFAKRTKQTLFHLLYRTLVINVSVHNKLSDLSLFEHSFLQDLVWST